jgi:hypothetical protein
MANKDMSSLYWNSEISSMSVRNSGVFSTSVIMRNSISYRVELSEDKRHRISHTSGWYSDFKGGLIHP